jgi:hypothetical protein
MSALPCHRLQAGPIVRTIVNTTEDDNQWTFRATGATPVDFCDLKKSGGFPTSRSNVVGFLKLTRILCSYCFLFYCL